MSPVRVLVTGAGSGVGQGIVKSLRLSSVPLTIISSDISTLGPALYRADQACLMPKVETAPVEAIINEIKKLDIQVILIGSEYDVNFYSQNKEIIEKETGALVVVSPPETVEIADDKWLTSEFLRENKLSYADSYLPASTDDAVSKAESWGYPVVLKTRTGTSNRHVHIVYSSDEIRSLFQTVPKPMLQKTIDIPQKFLDKEFTCSIFRCADGSLLGPFTARRTLRAGSSWVIEVAPFKEINNLMLGIAEKLSFMASMNVQLMMSTEGPVPFEFNARFSGTTAVRAYFGFNEPDFAIRSYFLKEKIPVPEIRKGVALRYLEEVFIDDAEASQLENYFSRGKKPAWF